MIDLSNVIALALGSDDVLQIQNAIGTVLWQKIIYYNVNISAGSNGTVSVNGVSGNYSQSVPSGTVLTIEGTGDTGYNFDEWSDGVSTNPRTITVTGDLTLTAAFESALPNYFYIENGSLEKTLKIHKNDANAPTIEVFKSTDGTNWTSMGSTNITYITATVPANSKLYLKATTNTWGSSASYYNNIFVDGSGHFNIGGNIMSLLYGDNFEGQTSFPNNDTYIFTHLFDGDTNLFNTSNLILPATTMTQGCYLGMFKGCTSLITAPALPATTLTQVCYSTMFQNCSSLNKVTTYADDISATYCTYNWLDGTAATGNFFNLGGATYESGASGIPTGWTEHTSL